MTARCPHCGGNADPEAPVTRGRWWIGPTIVYHDGEQIALARAHARTFYAIARANGEAITHRDLPNSSPNTLAAHFRALRRTFGDRLPVRASNRGYEWDARA